MCPYERNNIIANSSKNINYPITRSDHIRKYRKKHSAVRHDYYTMCSKYSHLDKCMFTFTCGSRGRGVYSKLRLSNEIKSYITYLIANSKSEIYFFSNIEIGHSLKNPHVHTQIWSDDKNAVRRIYGKVIEKFFLKSNRCNLSEPQHDIDYYDYLVKDYSKDLSDDAVWNLEQTKIRMRKTLGFQLRFYSKSKSKYSQKLYRIAYRSYGVLRASADEWLDFILPVFFNKEAFLYCPISSFISILRTRVLYSELYCSFVLISNIILFAPSNDPPS